MNIKFRKRKLTQDEKIAIVADYAGDMPIKDIKERYKVSHQTIYNVLHEISNKEEYDKKN